MFGEITLNVPQGVGDIFWTYQKFAPLCTAINYNILATEINTVQQRSKDWLNLFPKTKNVQMRVVPGFEYEKVATSRFNMRDVIPVLQNGSDAHYSVNLPLEQGVRIEDIDPEFVVESPVDVRADECPLPFEKYIVVYVSGSTKSHDATRLHLWDTGTWAKFIAGFRKKYPQANLPVILIGASYDAEVARNISTMLTKVFKIENHVFIDSYPGNVAYIMKNATAMLSYQSGLSILADNYNIPQIMMYFPFLEKMMYTWCRKDNIGRVFQADIFTSSYQDVLDRSNLEL